MPSQNSDQPVHPWSESSLGICTTCRHPRLVFMNETDSGLSLQMCRFIFTLAGTHIKRYFLDWRQAWIVLLCLELGKQHSLCNWPTWSCTYTWVARLIYPSSREDHKMLQIRTNTPEGNRFFRSGLILVCISYCCSHLIFLWLVLKCTFVWFTIFLAASLVLKYKSKLEERVV